MRALSGLRARGIACCIVLATCASARADALSMWTGSMPVALPDTARRIIDDFESLAVWQAIPAEGVELTIHGSPGVSGQAMRLEVDVSRGGYAIARRELDLPLPENYEITFWLRGDLPPNTLEFKLVDASGENVWWHVQRDIEWPTEWQRVRIRKRQVEFAWGPRGGGDLERAAAIELAITAGAGGGRGSVWLDELAITHMEPVRPYDLTPVATASSSLAGAPPSAVIDGDADTEWRNAGATDEWLALDFLRAREYGGITVRWAPGARSEAYDVQLSADGDAWETVHEVRNGAGERDWIALPETESRWLRLLFRDERERAIRAVDVQPLEWAATENDFLRAVSAESWRGAWPRHLTGEQSYWTIVGLPHNDAEALISEDGTIEPWRAGPSIEPFLHVNGRLITWNDARAVQRLERDYLPIPTVEWSGDAATLEITALADGDSSHPVLRVRYRVHNKTSAQLEPTLFLTVRPIQVNPSWQFLGTPGGAARIHQLNVTTAGVRVDGADLLLVGSPDGSGGGAMSFHGGNVVDLLRDGRLPMATDVNDPVGYASGAIEFALGIPEGAWRDVHVTMPMRRSQESNGQDVATAAQQVGSEDFALRLSEVADRWERELGRVRIELPGDAADLSNAIRATLAYILINRNGAAIQPGTRAYRRSWIRDGSLTSSALLRLGHEDAVRDYIEWYAPFQYSNGKVPCCVDHRGADPVPEHDSHGQFIWLIAEYVRFTGDTALARRHWPRVLSAVAYMDSLRRSRMTEAYVTGDSTAFFGLLPQSISHEGYAEKPMHSFWDDLFGLRGYKDAAELAAMLGLEDERRSLEQKVESFRRHIVEAYRATMAKHDIDWLAGAVELGDFDATSTTVAVSPVNEARRLPPVALRRTFDKYLENFRARRDGREPWEAYTPYEWRTVGTFVRLGRPAEAHEIARWFMGHRRPSGWNHWAEVVWRDERLPRFIGDMPHGWVGSDFIRGVLDMIAYEDEADSALVVGAGMPVSWVRTAPGVLVEGLRTPWGPLALRAVASHDTVRMTLAPGLRPPAGGVVVHAPWGCVPRQAFVGDQQTPSSVRRDRLVLRKLPEEVMFICGSAPRRPDG